MNLKVYLEKGLTKFAKMCRESELIYDFWWKGEYNQRLILNLLIAQVQPWKISTVSEEVMPQERRIQAMSSFVLTQKGDRERELLTMGTVLRFP